MKILAAKKIALALALTGMATGGHTQIITSDPTNLVPNLMTWSESMMQTIEQVESRVLQLQQYENMIKNTVAPVTQIWSRVQYTVDKLQSLNSRLQQFRNQMNNMNSYMDRYRDINFYRNNNGCFSKDQICTLADLRKLRDQISFASENVKKANDDLFKSLVEDAEMIEDDGRELDRLQREASKDSGQMQALVRGNMLAANMAHQILQMRRQQTQMLDQLVTRAQADADRQAARDAAYYRLHDVPDDEPSNPIEWHVFQTRRIP
ncbi:MAG: P-type conjugative transfer protein TrbJ [Azoarcus sp.]|jgi:P-type conjugative transfer protein TrbJ|nr:P-type conjugative transfer protein TrbJ [Azoarcus sp.]